MSKEAKPAEVKLWNPLLGVVFAAALLFGAEIVSSFILIIYPLLNGWSQSRTNNWLNNSTFASFLYTFLAEILILVAVYFFIKRYKGGFQAIGLKRPKWFDPIVGLAGVVPYFIIYGVFFLVITHLFPSLNVNEKQQLGFNNVHGFAQLAITFVSLVILPPIGEEILFRGIIYTSLKKALPLWVAVIGTSVLFAAGHLAEGGSSGPLYIAAIDTFSLSLVLIYLREQTGRLYAGMTLHALKNFIAFMALYVFVH